MAIEIQTLKAERERLKALLREIEIEQRKIEAQIKAQRQQELKVKREIDALSTLIELNEAKPETAE